MVEQQQGQPQHVRAIVRKLAGNARGYALAVDITPSADVTAWTAELVLPQGATAKAGPGTTVEMQGQVAVLTPKTQQVGTSEHGVAYAAISGSTNAPTHARVKATVGDRDEFAQVDGFYISDKGGRLQPATEETWPGSTKASTNPHSFTHGSGGGSGGGGGGGGQFSCRLFVDHVNQTVTHEITTDAGGGGGAGGGYGESGGDYHQHQQQNRGK